MAVTVLCVGDIHLGRVPRGIPLELETPRPVDAWKRTVRFAIDENVDAVLLAGDVVDDMEDRFEAYGALASGVGDLVRAGIPVVGVAGNHDFEAIGRLAEYLPAFDLLGRKGAWEVKELDTRDGSRIRLVGWSFPTRRVTFSPLDSFPALPEDDIPVIGLLHCDLGGSGADAPVARTDLRNTPVDAWFLGHIHRPDALRGPHPIGYLGSLMGLDPTETGVHGPWLARIERRGLVEVEHLALAPLRWETLTVDLDDLDIATAEQVQETLEAALIEAIDSLHATMTEEPGESRIVGCRVRIEGRSPHHRELRRALEATEILRTSLPRGDVKFFIDELIDDTSPAMDLEDLARGSDPPGLLARSLLAVRDRTDRGQQLIDAATIEIRRLADQQQWSRLAPVDLDTDVVAQMLYRTGLRGLEELDAQVPGTGEAGR